MSVQVQSRQRLCRQPQTQRCVAYLPFVKIMRKAAKPGLFSDAPSSIGEHLKRRRVELGLRQQDVAARLRVNE
jgi:hypothetical protein